MKINTTSKLRECFISGEGKKLVVADMSQIEPRITAHFASFLFPSHVRVPLLNVFLEGIDLYADVANKVLALGLPKDKLTKSAFKKDYSNERDLGKVIQLATTYGLGADKLAKQLTKQLGRTVEYPEAKKHLDAYWEHYYDVRALKEEVSVEFSAHGYITTLFGRPVYVDPKQVDHKGLNYKIQGSASDYCLFTQLWVEEECRNSGIEADLLMLVHDEVIYEVPEHQAEEFKLLLETVMTKGWTFYAPHLNIQCPLEIEAAVGDNWGIKS